MKRAGLCRGHTLLFFHHADEAGKEIVAVVRARRCLRMILHTEEWQRPVLEAFHSLIVEIDVGQLDDRLVHRFPVHGKAVILGGNFDIAREEIIAIGDNLNDLEMIKYAGLGVAVANAVDDLKIAADYVAEQPLYKGVEEVITKFVLSEEGTQRSVPVFDTKS